MEWKGIIIVLLGLFAWAYVAQAAEPNEPPAETFNPHWSIEGGMGLGATGEDLLQSFLMYWPKYGMDGAVGLVVLGGDPIPDNHAAVGPAIEFPTGPMYETALEAILPDGLAEGLNNLAAKVQPFGFGGLPFDEEFNPIVLAGTGFHIWPAQHVQPTIRTEWIEPSGNSEYTQLQGWWTFFDLLYLF